MSHGYTHELVINPMGDSVKVICLENGKRIGVRQTPILEVSGWEIDTLEQAEGIAAAQSKHTGKPWIAVDEGQNTSPQYHTREMFVVGEPVSYGFNGDMYPSGHIKHITKSLRVITLEDGSKFWRYRKTGMWLKNKTWALVKGHHSRYNREF